MGGFADAEAGGEGLVCADVCGVEGRWVDGEGESGGSGSED